MTLTEPTPVLTEQSPVLTRTRVGATRELNQPILHPNLHPNPYPSQHPSLVRPQRSMFDVLLRGELAGVLLQDSATISTSIPWLRSQRYWANAGVDVFTSGAVPYAVTNNGEQSRKAVEMYLASLRAAEQSGCREATSYVLELGTGSGLFAKLFLDQLRVASKRDYERTTYIVADYSTGLLEDTRKTGVFAAHEDRVRRVHLPTRDWRAALATALPEAVGAIRAIHGNYLLDSLPFTILSCFEDRLFELRIRTRLRKELLKPGMSPPSTTDALEMESWVADVLESVEWPDTALEFEAEYVPVERASLPLSELIPDATLDGTDSTPGASVQVLHGYGAIEFLGEALGALRADGYFVAVDYDVQGPRIDPIEFQTYGSSVSAGVNFSQLVAFARARTDCEVGVPPEDPTELQARCFARQGVPTEIIQLFETIYSKETAERIEAPYRAALERAQSGQFEAARGKFAEACCLQPANWSLLLKIAQFLADMLHEHGSALEVVQRALLLNHLAPELWNILGDCHYNLGDMAAAERAYREAVRLSPRDANGFANLAYVFLKRGEVAEALRMIGEALALDDHGVLRAELLTKQTEALTARAEVADTRKRHSWKRRSGTHALPGRAPAAHPSNGGSKAPSSNGAHTAYSSNGVVRGST
jgi:tetratricopeptide (TPR) repeat protein